MNEIPIRAILNQATRPLLSYEFFPPKDDIGMENLRITCEKLIPTRPDFVTVTYGAGGSTRNRTIQVCSMLTDLGFRPVMPHVTCVGSSRHDLRGLMNVISNLGYSNIMALRGDPPKGDTTFTPAPGGPAYASELVELIKADCPGMCCGVAAYPEKHPEAASLDEDLANLKRKLDAGGDFATTQLFFDNRVYYRFMEKARAIGIDKPVVPGLLPALSLKQVERMSAMCQASVPAALIERLRAVGDDPLAAEQIGLEWATSQVRDLLENGAPGVHLYILNRSKAALFQPLLDLFDRALA